MLLNEPTPQVMPLFVRGFLLGDRGQVSSAVSSIEGENRLVPSTLAGWLKQNSRVYKILF